MRERCLAALVFFTALAAPVFCAPRQLPMEDFVQDVWDAGREGLPNPGVTAIRQTRDGFLWLATFTGVVRFDGAQFRRPEVADERVRVALADHIRCFIETEDGAMWFGTRRYGAVRVKDGIGQIVGTKDGLVASDVRAMAQTRDGTLWFATSDGISARDGAGRFRTFKTSEGLASNNVFTLLVDTDDTLWAGTNNWGVARLDGLRFQQVALDIPADVKQVEESFGLPFRTVGVLVRDAKGVLWAGTSIGLMSVPEHGSGAKVLYPGAINGVSPSRDGGFWLSSGGGLRRLREGRWQTYTAQQGLLNDGLMAVYEDTEGSLWVGTRIGLARLRPRVIRTYMQRDGIGHDAITCVIETSSGDIWVGHRNGMSRLRDGRWTTIGVQDGLPNPQVRTFAEAPDGALFVGTLSGLARYKDGRMTTYLGQGDPYNVRALAFDKSGQLWIATVYGLDRLRGEVIERVIERQAACDTSNPNAMIFARDGTLWMAMASALMRVRDGRTECFKDDAVLSRNDIRSIHEDDQGRLWLGSIGGLWTVEGGKRHVLATDSAPFAATIYAIVDDGRGFLWWSTQEGLFRIDKARLHLYADPTESMSIYRSFGTADGMDSPVGTGGGQPNAWRGRDGRLWIATATGVAVVDPARIESDTRVPPVFIEQLVADRRPVDLRGSRRLPAGTRDVELEFVLQSYIAPDRVRYKYKLEGYDRDWVDSGNRRTAYYTNLVPGRYRFRVIAASHNGIWNQTGAVLDFELLPRFYERRWFVPLLVLLAVLAAVAFYRLRIARMRARAAELQQKVDEAIANIQLLRGLLPICASCRRVREDTGYWRQIEAYVMEHSSAKFSHGICPECWAKLREEDPNLPEYQSR